MPPIRVRIPGTGVIEFPEGTPREEIERVLSNPKQFTPLQQRIPSEREAFQEAVELGRPSIGETTGNLFTRQVLPSLLPTAGMLGGGALGALAAGPTVAGVPAGVLAGEAAGGAAGEALNQLLGITEPSVTQIGLSAAAPGVGRVIGGGVSRFGKGFLKRLPGTSVVAQEEAVATARALSQRMIPLKTSEALFGELAAVNPELKIPTRNLREFAKHLLQQEKVIAEEGSEVLQNPTLRNLAEDLLAPPGRAKQLRAQLKDLQATSPILGPHGEAIESVAALAQRAQIATQLEKIGAEKSVSPDGMRLILKRIGQRTGQVKGLTPTEERDAMRGLYAALKQDLDDAIEAGGQVGEAASLLKIAREAVRREQATLELAEVIESGVFTREGDLMQSIRPKKILEAFQKKRVLRESFSPAEQKEIISTIKALKGIPALPQRAGVFVGAGLPVSAGGLGFAAANLIGAGPVATTAITGLAGAAPMILARASMTEVGRKIVRRLLTPRGFLDQRGMAILASFVRAQTATKPLKTSSQTGGP